MSTEEHIQERPQLSFDLDLPSGDRVHFSIDASLQSHDPESTLCYDTLGTVLRKTLESGEFARIESLLKKLDWHLDLIYRDREIKERIRELTDQGKKIYQAVQIVAGEEHLSEDHIYTVYYDKKQNGYAG